MEIGKKIRELRNAKLMTQSELAGDEITRNMLSKIENDAALPSLVTVIYLADKLGVPAGYLIADSDDEFTYRKMNEMKNIRRAYTDKNFELCRDICISSLGGSDDETELILAECCLNMGEEYINSGQLHKACAILDEAAVHAGKTIYNTDVIVCAVASMFYFMRKISPSFVSEEIDNDKNNDFSLVLSCTNKLCRYIYALELLECNNFSIAEKYVEYETDIKDIYSQLYLLHIKARLKMKDRDYGRALDCLYEIIKSDEVPPKILVYLACCDIEICCRETGDYKGAYEYSATRMSIAESMLSDV